MNLEPTWTDARIGALKTANLEGLSASQIAARLGLTRNAVIGKLHRLGIVGKKPAYVPKPKVARRAPLSPRRLAPMPIEREITDLPPDASEFACTIVGLDADMCRYPLGEPSADMQYCGAPCVGSWCRRHLRIVFTRPERRER